MESRSIKIWVKTWRLLRMLAALEDLTISALVDKLARREADRRGIVVSMFEKDDMLMPE